MTVAWGLVKWMQTEGYSNSQIAIEVGVTGVTNEDDLIWALASKFAWGDDEEPESKTAPT